MAINVIKISPFFHPWYYEYYLQGIYEYYGKNFAVEFCFEPRFLALKELLGTPFEKDFFYYEVHQQDKSVKKILLSADDMLQVHETYYKTVDVYAKVNVTNDLMRQYPKLVPIGPNFGVRYLSRWQYYWLSWKIWRATGQPNPFWKAYHTLSLKRVFLDTYKQLATLSESGNRAKPFIFYLNYPWQKHSALTNVRKQIIGQLQELAEDKIIDFEGGFSRRRLGPFKGLEKWSATRLYTLKQYLQKVQKSTFVLNTPAVHGCLGWKLGEYFALGKIIISTPYNRVIPGAQLQDFVHIIPDDTGLLKQELEQILRSNTNELQQKSIRAKQYFNNVLSPQKVIERIHLQAIKDG